MTLALAHTAKREAERMRAEWLYSVQVGVLTVPDLIQAATSESGRPLRRITLNQLLEAQGWGRARNQRALDHIRNLLGTTSDRRLNVAWLVDARADGRRLQVWADALKERVPPWTGFPYTPCPQGGGTSHG